MKLSRWLYWSNCFAWAGSIQREDINKVWKDKCNSFVLSPKPLTARTSLLCSLVDVAPPMQYPYLWIIVSYYIAYYLSCRIFFFAVFFWVRSSEFENLMSMLELGLLKTFSIWRWAVATFGLTNLRLWKVPNNSALKWCWMVMIVTVVTLPFHK